MKFYKIKKRADRFVPYIAGEQAAPFKKPKLPFRFFSKINKPNLFEKQEFTFAVPQQEPQEQEQRRV